MSKETVESWVINSASDLEDVVESLRDNALGGLDAVYVEDLRLVLQKQTLTDGSVVFNLVPLVLSMRTPEEVVS